MLNNSRSTRPTIFSFYKKQKQFAVQKPKNKLLGSAQTREPFKKGSTQNLVKWRKRHFYQVRLIPENFNKKNLKIKPHGSAVFKVSKKPKNKFLGSAQTREPFKKGSTQNLVKWRKRHFYQVRLIPENFNKKNLKIKPHGSAVFKVSKKPKNKFLGSAQTCEPFKKGSTQNLVKWRKRHFYQVRLIPENFNKENLKIKSRVCVVLVFMMGQGLLFYLFFKTS